MGTAELAMLTSNGHSVIKYCLHNDAINNMSGFDAASPRPGAGRRIARSGV